MRMQTTVCIEVEEAGSWVIRGEDGREIISSCDSRDISLFDLVRAALKAKAANYTKLAERV